MTFSFLHGGIALIGLASAAIPIIIHLLLKQRPKPITFPALQLIRKKRETTVRRIRLQHLLLLALRVALLVLIAMALARPTLHSAMFSIDQEAPVAAAVIVDNSFSMEYRHHGKTRLQAAKEVAEQVVKKLPDQSKITVIESASPVGTIPLDVPGAIGQLESIQIQPASRPITDALANALKGLAKAELQRREIYLISDLAKNAWDFSSRENIQQLADLIETGVKIYVIDVGVPERENIAIQEIEIVQQATGGGGEITIKVPLINTGSKPVDVNSIVLSIDGEPKHTRSLRLEAGQTQELEFAVSGLAEGVHQGEITVNAGDPLSFDDVRYFTFQRQPPLRILIVVDLLSDALNWDQALVPDFLRAQGQARFDVQVVPSAKLGPIRFDDYDVVNLINVGSLSQDHWIKLASYVQAGGGLFTSLGERIDPVSYNSAPAQSVLPCTLGDEVQTQTELAPTRMSHPVLQKFRTLSHHMLDEYPVYTYRKATLDEQGQSLVVIPYANGDPALLERTFRGGARGKSLLYTSSVFRRGTGDWSDVPLGWAYIIFAEQVTHYLAGVSETQWNYPAGNFVTVDLDPNQPLTLFTVTDPTGNVDRVTVEPRSQVLSLPAMSKPGHYHVDAKEGDRAFSTGFSVNERTEESELTPVSADQLRELIGEDRLVIAPNAEALERVVDEARVGRELFPWIMIVVLIIVCGEGYLANRFYRQPSLAPAT